LGGNPAFHRDFQALRESRIAEYGASAPVQRPQFDKNREKNRGVFRSGLEIVELCSKSANFVQRQGIIREFRGFPANSLSTRRLDAFSGRLKKLTGNYQGIGPARPSFPPPVKAETFRMTAGCHQKRKPSTALSNPP